MIGPQLAQMLATSDFEDGTMSPWFDQSPAKVNWRVEDYNSPAEVSSPAPAPVTGRKYLRATRNSNLTSGLAVLQSPVFTALPGDKVRFSFWIRSQQPQGSNLEVSLSLAQFQGFHFLSFFYKFISVVLGGGQRGIPAN
jgi:hypothetical protein